MAAIPRIVSLLPSSTEIVHALGAGDGLVGRSHECDYPKGVETLPVCTRARVDLTGDSRQIDTQVKQAVADAASIYEVLETRLSALSPDVIITQDQCEVCAVSLADVETALRACTMTDTRIVSLSPMTLDDVYRDVMKVAEALGREAEGVRVVDDMRRRADNVARTAVIAATRPSVACIEWCDPLMAAGNWVPAQVDLAGGEDMFGRHGEHAPWLDDAAVLETDPDILVFMPCGYDLERSTADAASVLTRTGWDSLRAVRDGRVYVTDANAYFNRPGPRLADSTEMMAEMLHPSLFAPAHQGTAWRTLR